MFHPPYVIYRKKYRQSFIFIQDDKRIKDSSLLQRLRSCYVPPAYEHVAYHEDPSAECYAIAIDAKGKRQYFYTQKWHQKSNDAKFQTMKCLSKKMNHIRHALRRLIVSSSLQDRLIALVLLLIMEGNFRIGSPNGVRDYGSYGVITLRKEHIHVNDNNTIDIAFRGKKGVLNESRIRSKPTVRILRHVLETNENPFLFSYRKGKVNIKITAEDVNAFLKRFGNFSTKTFRTWFVNVDFIQQMKRLNALDLPWKKKQTKAISLTAKRFHHTPTVCQKSYILPTLITSLPNQNWEKSPTIIFSNFLNQ